MTPAGLTQVKSIPQQPFFFFFLVPESTHGEGSSLSSLQSCSCPQRGHNGTPVLVLAGGCGLCPPTATGSAPPWGLEGVFLNHILQQSTRCHPQTSPVTPSTVWCHTRMCPNPDPDPVPIPSPPWQVFGRRQDRAGCLEQAAAEASQRLSS